MSSLKRTRKVVRQRTEVSVCNYMNFFSARGMLRVIDLLIAQGFVLVSLTYSRWRLTFGEIDILMLMTLEP